MKNTDIKTDKRIENIISLMPKSKVVADIGCDHGITCVAIILRYKAKFMIASDISEPSLDKAKKLAKKHNLVDKFDFRCGDGLDVLEKDEVDLIIISGIGGELICDILKKGQDKLKNRKLILSPNNREFIVRDWLVKNNYKIDNEILLEEKGRFYQIIYAMPGKDNQYSDVESEVGKHILNRKDETLKRYIKLKLKNMEIALDNLQKSHGNIEKKQEFSDKINSYKEIYSWFQKK